MERITQNTISLNQNKSWGTGHHNLYWNQLQWNIDKLNHEKHAEQYGLVMVAIASATKQWNVMLHILWNLATQWTMWLQDDNLKSSDLPAL